MPRKTPSRGLRPKRVVVGRNPVSVQNPNCRQLPWRNRFWGVPQPKPPSLSSSSCAISTRPSLKNSSSSSVFSLQPLAAQLPRFSPLSFRNSLFKFPPAHKTSPLSTFLEPPCWRWPSWTGCCWVSSTSSSRRSPSLGSTDLECLASDWSCSRTRSGSTRWTDQTGRSSWFRYSSRMVTTLGVCLPRSSLRRSSSLPCSELACFGL